MHKKKFSLIMNIFVLFIGLSLLCSFTYETNAVSTLVGYWKFDKGSGLQAYDSSGYGNAGIITYSEWVPGISGTGIEFEGDGYEA